MKRIAILTAGGDTPALNATLFGAVMRSNQREVDALGIIKGFSGLLNPRLPHVRLNPLFRTIPELDATRGGTVIGASRDYLSPNDPRVEELALRFARLGVEGLVCIGGDGTLAGMQALSRYLPTVLAPKTIDNDLGLNYRHEPDEWQREPDGSQEGFRYVRGPARARFSLDQIVNYVTPGFATAVFVSAWGVQRIRSTAESHRRIAIVEVMGRQSGYLALGAAYGQPDILLVPEVELDIERLVERVTQVYELQKHAVIVCAEGITDSKGRAMGSEEDLPSIGGLRDGGAAEAIRRLLVERLGDAFFRDRRRNDSAETAIFTRKVGHTQRGGRPVYFDQFYATQLGGHAVDLLLEGQVNRLAILQHDREHGFYVAGIDANEFRDRWGIVHPRRMHASFYDPDLLRLSQQGVAYLRPIFDNALAADDMEHVRSTLFAVGNLTEPYHSVNIDIHKRIAYAD